ncbi:hypothetical protein GGR56DRAFT_670029 [Xylariaceae sp. FL0804]|nr:hypothetical protein GGR56DRAFT_670029 [Xylariaceae sp. FL0804]
MDVKGLSLAAGSNWLLERYRCTTPMHHRQPWHGFAAAYGTVLAAAMLLCGLHLVPLPRSIGARRSSGPALIGLGAALSAPWLNVLA